MPISLLSSSAAWASKAELFLLPSLESAVNACPEKLVAYETPQPRSPGGYATDGMIQLQEIATDISVAEVGPFSVSWVGTLKPDYASCEATAGLGIVDGFDFTGPSYIRVQLTGGEAKVILDMTGITDPNGFTSVILDQTMRDGNPRWTWGGTD